MYEHIVKEQQDLAIFDIRKRMTKHNIDKMEMELSPIINCYEELHSFYLGKIHLLENMIKTESLFDGEYGEDVKLPYEKCWFDWENEDGSRAGCSAVDFDGEIIKIEIYTNPKGHKPWYPVSANTYIGNKTALKEAEYEERNKRTDDVIICKYLSEKVLVAYTAPESKSIMTTLYDNNGYSGGISVEEWDEIVSGVKSLNLALLFLSCKNIITEKKDAPLRLNKKRLKSGKPQIKEYNVIRLSNSFLNTPNKQNTTTREINYRIGHFKTFTEDKPLFGKYSGRFWWSPLNKSEQKTKNIIKI